MASERVVVRFIKKESSKVERANIGSTTINISDGSSSIEDSTGKTVAINATIADVQGLIAKAFKDLGNIVSSVNGKSEKNIEITVDDIPRLNEEYCPRSLMAENNGIATLDAEGKIPESQLPGIAVNDIFLVNSLIERDELVTTGKVQRGDIAIVREGLVSTPYMVDKDGIWHILSISGLNSVLTINGKTGNVILTKEDLGLGEVANVPLTTKEEAMNPLEPTNKSVTTPLRVMQMIQSLGGITIHENGDIVLDPGEIGDITKESESPVIIFDEDDE